MSASSVVKRSRFLDLKALAALEHMRFSTRHRLEGTYSGRHQSRQHGGAGEFVDYRQYVGSEDLRRLDWKVLGRLGKAYVRIHQEETNLVCTIAIDASQSMQFGARGRGDGHGSKLEFAQYFATAISHIIGCGQDQVGLAALDDALREHVPPGGTASHITHLQEVIEGLSTRPARTMADGLRSLFERSSRRGTLLLVSDFLCEDLEAAFTALMAVSVAVPLAILSNPTWISRVPPPEGKPRVTVLVDRSASMSLVEGDDQRRRFDLACQTARKVVGKPSEAYDVHVRTFADASEETSAQSLAAIDPDGESTDLAGAIESALDDDLPQGQALVLLTDAAHNGEGGIDELRRAAEKARSLAAPIYAKVIGGRVQIDDLAVSIDSPEELAFVGQPILTALTAELCGPVGVAIHLAFHPFHLLPETDPHQAARAKERLPCVTQLATGCPSC